MSNQMQDEATLPATGRHECYLRLRNEAGRLLATAPVPVIQSPGVISFHLQQYQMAVLEAGHIAFYEIDIGDMVLLFPMTSRFGHMRLTTPQNAVSLGQTVSIDFTFSITYPVQ
jgi:hypothetical protein